MQGLVWSQGAGRAVWWNQEIPFYCRPSPPFQGTYLSRPRFPEKEKTKYEILGFPLAGPGFGARPGTAGTPVLPSSRPSRPQGTGPILGDSRGSGAQCCLVPELREVSPNSTPVQLKVVSHEPRGSGNPASGRWRVRPEGAAQSTYMHRDPPDGCQEFPMKDAGGEVWATRPGQWRTSGGLCPFSPPPPASAQAARVFTERSVRGD